MDEAAYIDAQIDALRVEGQTGSAFHNLLELGPKILRTLVSRLNSEQRPYARSQIVRVLWELRDPSAVPALLGAIDDPSDDVCLAALDGLVTLGGEVATRGLRLRIKELEAEHPRAAWISEALDQMQPGLSS